MSRPLRTEMLLDALAIADYLTVTAANSTSALLLGQRLSDGDATFRFQPW